MFKQAFLLCNWTEVLNNTNSESSVQFAENCSISYTVYLKSYIPLGSVNVVAGVKFGLFEGKVSFNDSSLAEQYGRITKIEIYTDTGINNSTGFLYGYVSL